MLLSAAAAAPRLLVRLLLHLEQPEWRPRPLAWLLLLKLLLPWTRWSPPREIFRRPLRRRLSRRPQHRWSLPQDSAHEDCWNCPQRWPHRLRLFDCLWGLRLLLMDPLLLCLRRKPPEDRQADRQTDARTDGQIDGRTGRHTDGQTDTRTDRQADRHADRQTDRQTDR